MKSTRERLDAHNSAVDKRLVRLGRCGAIHLATGRRCFLATDHARSCTFLTVSETMREAAITDVVTTPGGE